MRNNKQRFLRHENPNYFNAPYCDAVTLEEAVLADKLIRKKTRTLRREKREKEKIARDRAKITLPKMKFMEDE